MRNFTVGVTKSGITGGVLGLGLYLCRAIVEAHKGQIQVSDNDPVGAVFSVTLPLKEVIVYE